MNTQKTGNNAESGWDLADATSTGHQVYRGRSGEWYIDQDVGRIILSPLQSVHKINDKKIIGQVRELLTIFLELINEFRNSGHNIRNLPALVGSALEDGSFLIEWILTNYHVGFVVETDSKESAWYLVEKGEKTDSNSTGLLGNKEDKQKIVTQLFFYVAYNS